MIIFKWNELICCGGSGGGGGGGADSRSTGNYSGAATGYGQDGYGKESDGKPGIFGGGVLGGIPGVGSGASEANFKAQLSAITPEVASEMLADMAQNKELQNNPQLTNALVSKLPTKEAVKFAESTYAPPKELAAAWSLFSPASPSIGVLTKIGAYMAGLTGQLVNTDTYSAGQAPSTAQKGQLAEAGFSNEDIDAYANAVKQTEQVSRKDQDRAAATNLVTSLTGSQPGGGRDGDLGVDHVLGVLDRGGRELSDMSQGAGLTEEWTDYVNKRKSEMSGLSTPAQETPAPEQKGLLDNSNADNTNGILSPVGQIVRTNVYDQLKGLRR